MQKRIGRLFLICFTCGLLAACSGPTPTHLVSSNVDPCSLVTVDEMSKVVGFQAKTEPEGQPQTGNAITTKNCTYTYTNPVYDVNYGLFTVTHPTNVFISIDITPDSGAAHDDFQTGIEIYSNVQTMGGLGDAASAGYNSDPMNVSLSVLKDNVVLGIGFGNEMPWNALDLEKQIAHIALKRL
jgi:hypothetical protein